MALQRTLQILGYKEPRSSCFTMALDIMLSIVHYASAGWILIWDLVGAPTAVGRGCGQFMERQSVSNILDTANRPDTYGSRPVRLGSEWDVLVTVIMSRNSIGRTRISSNSSV